MPYPEIPFIKLMAEKILPFEGPAAMTIEKEIFPDGILILTSNFKVLFANKLALKILNASREDLIGYPLNIKDLSKKSNLIHAITIEESQRIIELKTRPFEILDTQYVLVILQDITAHYENIGRLNFAIETTQLGLWDYEFRRNSTSINSYYATMLNYTFEEFESGSWVTLVHPIDLEDVWDKWNKHIANRIPFYFSDYRIRTKTGAWKWVRARGMIKDRDKEGNPLHFIGTHQDITTQKQAERQLQILYAINVVSNELITIEEKLEKALKNIITILFADKGIIYLNNQQKKLELVASAGFDLQQIYTLESLREDKNGLSNIKILPTDGLLLSKNNSRESQFLSVCNSSGAIIFPISIAGRDQVFGSLQIHWTKEQPITNLEKEIALTAANQLAETIERENLRQIARASVLDKERRRLARELHDSLSQSLYSVLLTADGGEDYARQGDIQKTKEIFSNIKGTIQQSLKEMRLLIYELRPSILSDVGLLEALQHRLDTVEKRAGINTSFKCNIKDQPSAITETELYGIAHEALNNVLKHSGADSVSISLTQLNQETILEITDDGIGFQLQESPASGGFGISSMKERAEKIGGRVEIISKPDRGTRIKVYAPLEVKSGKGIR